MSWKKVSLFEITSLIGDGLHGTPLYDDNGEYYFINGNNLKDGNIVLKEGTKKISKQEYLKIQKKLTNRTILIGINGTLGNLALYNDEKIALGKSACYLNIKKDINKLFVYYSLKSSDFQNYAQLFATGATIKNLSLKAIRNYEFNIPSLKIQNKIVTLLSNYDNLIQNNTKRIKLLAEMAEELYKEWFVRLRFPEYEKSKIVDGIPEGWEKKKLGDIYNTSSGATPSRKKEEYYNGNIPWIKTGELKNIFVLDVEEFITEEGVKNSSAKLFKEDTVIIAMYCAMPYLSILIQPSSTNQACCAFLPKNNYLKYSFSYFFIKNAQLGLINYAHGAAQQNLSQEIISKYRVLFPSKDVIVSYSNIVQDFFYEIKVLMKKNQTLKQTRDLLLPRVMSGKLDVRNLPEENNL